MSFNFHFDLFRLIYCAALMRRAASRAPSAHIMRACVAFFWDSMDVYGHVRFRHIVLSQPNDEIFIEKVVQF